MTEDKLKRAEEIKKSLDCIINITHFISFPYPRLTDSVGNEVCWVSLDKETLSGLKEVMNEYLTKRIEELSKEFKEL